MRLTLRTLLAYLDDTLEAGEIKQIGQKVAESDAAQELVARIKQVTRRRRLTTPTDAGAGDRFDANRVAAYLDNELTGEEIAEIEKICLESDVHLAEVAASHQILTLVLGEPALVPPTAKRRMYALQHGRPAKNAVKPMPNSKNPAPANGSPEDADADDTLMTLPLFRKFPWLRWAVPLAAVVLLVILGIVMLEKLGTKADDNRRTERDTDKGTRSEDKKDDKEKKPDDRSKVPVVPDDSSVRKDDKPADDKKPMDKPPPTDKPPPPKDDKPSDSGKKPEPPPRKEFPAVEKNPRPDRKPVGTFDSAEEILVRKDGEGWKRIGVKESVNTSDLLVSLPGYRSKIQLDRKLDLVLWGNHPEITQLPHLESVVTLHEPVEGVDVDLTLHRGRAYLTSKKTEAEGPCLIRLRFWKGEIWDLTLEGPDASIGFELQSEYTPDAKAREGEDPMVILNLYLLKGHGSLRSDRRTFGELSGPTGRALLHWNNREKLRGPTLIDRPIGEMNQDQPPPTEPPELVEASRQLKRSLTELAGTLVKPDKRVEVALREFTLEANFARRVSGIRCLAAVDAIEDLLDELAKEDRARNDVRQAALQALRIWLNRSPEQTKILFDAAKTPPTGLLLKKEYSNTEAQAIIDLLFPLPPESLANKETYRYLVQYLRHPKIIIRDLAIRHLQRLAPTAEILYDPAGPPEMRERGYEGWKKLLDTGKLPPVQVPPKPPGMP